jgi:hypothetical protein
MTITPVFVLSLPRSGSTLVQRVLAAHDGVATAAEPWVALPHVYALRSEGTYAEYGHALASRAIREFADRLDGGEGRYRRELRGFLERLYGAAADPDDRWFVDKTPRYHFIVEELFGLFPDARFVFLWRHPLAVVGSTVRTWANGKWMVDRWRTDLFEGVDHLTQAYRTYRDRAHGVRFEDLLTTSESWSAMTAYVGFPFDPHAIDRFAEVDVEARMGDPTGRRDWAALSTEPLDRWKTQVTTPWRKRWCREYLRWIGRERLAVMGYELDELLAELEHVPTRLGGMGSDITRTVYASSVRTGRATGGKLLWKASRGARSDAEAHEYGHTSSP